MANRKNIYEALKELWDADPNQSLAGLISNFMDAMEIGFYMDMDDHLPDSIYRYMNPYKTIEAETESRRQEREELFKKYVQLFESYEGSRISQCLVDTRPGYKMPDEEYLEVLEKYLATQRKTFLYLSEEWTIQVLSYQDNGNLAIEISCEEGNDVVTVNLGTDIGNGVKMPRFSAFLDENNCPHIGKALEDAGIAKPYMRFGDQVKVKNGFVTYPLYQFDEGVLRKCDPNGVEEYLQF